MRIWRVAWLVCGLCAADFHAARAQIVINFPSINAGGIVDAASFAAGQPVAAGSIVAIFGSQLAGQTVLAATVPLPYSLADEVSVTFNGVSAPVQFVSPGQINAQVPWEVLGAGINGTVNVLVTRNGVSSLPVPVMINQVAPGVYQANGNAFAINVTDPTSQRYASFAAPVGSLPPYSAYPAQAGDFLLVYASGLGAVNPTIADGAGSSDTTRNTLATPAVFLNGNVPATVTFSGLSSYPGVYQINIIVPAVPPGNAIPLQIQVGGFTTTVTTTIAIQAVTNQ